MNNPSLHTLVNFRAQTTLLDSFDRVCFLSGKNRTQVLSEMMKQRVSSVGSKLAIRTERDRSIDERLKTAVDEAVTPRVEDRGHWSKELYARRPFSSFGPQS